MELKTSACLACGKILDAASCIDDTGHAPGPGDITICFSCGHVMAFADDTSLRELTSDEMYTVAGNPVILAIQKARGLVKK
jgi:hypothetical protein